MSFSLAASHAKGKFATDNIFGANAAAVQAEAKVGKEKVVNATIGAILDDEGVLACLPTVEKVFRALPTVDLVRYSPIPGQPAFLQAAIDMTLGEYKPEAYLDAVATAGGCGVIHHAIWNYTELGDTVLTSDWYWGPYNVLCHDALRKLDTFQLFDEKQNFNLQAFQTKVAGVLAKQDSVLIILNTPAHNPTGYSLSDAEWDGVLQVAKECAQNPAKRIILLVDAAYLEFAGENSECRAFFSKFGQLPQNLLTIVAFSMSKAFTMYGQRVGAMIGMSSNKDVIQEFADINQYTSRATWSNINTPAMATMATIYHDAQLKAAVDAERQSFYHLIRERAETFVNEAAEVSLNMLPYRAGFFLSIPAKNPEAVCEKLQEDYIFAVPLAQGIRVAVCAVPAYKIKGMAEKFKQAIAKTE